MAIRRLQAALLSLSLVLPASSSRAEQPSNRKPPAAAVAVEPVQKPLSPKEQLVADLKNPDLAVRTKAAVALREKAERGEDISFAEAELKNDRNLHASRLEKNYPTAYLLEGAAEDALGLHYVNQKRWSELSEWIVADYDAGPAGLLFDLFSKGFDISPVVPALDSKVGDVHCEPDTMLWIAGLLAVYYVKTRQPDKIARLLRREWKIPGYVARALKEAALRDNVDIGPAERPLRDIFNGPHSPDDAPYFRESAAPALAALYFKRRRPDKVRALRARIRQLERDPEVRRWIEEDVARAARGQLE